jgi:hypothetical protein
VDQLNPHIMELLHLALDQTATITPKMTEFKQIIRSLRDKYQRHSKRKGKQRADVPSDVVAGDEMNIG